MKHIHFHYTVKATIIFSGNLIWFLVVFLATIPKWTEKKHSHCLLRVQNRILKRFKCHAWRNPHNPQSGIKQTTNPHTNTRAPTHKYIVSHLTSKCQFSQPETHLTFAYCIWINFIELNGDENTIQSVFLMDLGLKTAIEVKFNCRALIKTFAHNDLNKIVQFSWRCSWLRKQKLCKQISVSKQTSAVAR